MAKKRFQKAKVKYIAMLLSSLIVAFGFMPYFTVFASSQSITNIDYDVLPVASMQADIYAGKSSYYIGDDMSELRVPVRLKFVNGAELGVYAWAYLSGIVRYNFGTNIFGVDTNSPINVNPAYFEGVHTDKLNVIWDVNGIRLYLDNYRIDSGQGQYREIFLGYMVYQFDPPATGFTYVFPDPNRTSVTPSNCNMRGSAYEYGFADSVAYGIDNSTSVQDIYEQLLYISQDTSYLSSVVTQLQNINGVLGSIYNYMATLNTTEINNMRALIYALSGLDYSSVSNSALATATYNRWVQLIYDAINYQSPDSSGADQAADTLEQAHDQNDVAQESAYAMMDSSMNNIDFSVTVPQGLTNAALTIGNYITAIWGNAGSDFQFLVTATLTLGLITVVVGAINRFPKPDYYTDTTIETHGVRNGKPYRHISHSKRYTKRSR